MEVFKMLNVGQLVVQVANFLLLFFLFKFLVWKKVLGVLDARREGVLRDRAAIDATLAQTGQLKADFEAKMKAVDAEARARVAEAIQEGKKAADEIKKEAQLGAHKILETAREQTRYELARAKEDLMGDVVDLVMKTTEHVIEEKLTPEEDRRIAEDFLRRIEKIS